MQRVNKKNLRPVTSGFIGGLTQTNDQEYEVIEVTADSGAVTTVGPKDQCAWFPIEETAASRAGRNFVGATGQQLRTMGLGRSRR